MQTNGAMQVSYPQQQQQQNRSMDTVSLSRLIEFSIQRTYHELTVLTELLPRKSDMERKIEIVTFVNRTKQLFIRLLALVKWAGSAGKVEKCSTIVSFLDKQSMLFTETADNLAKMSRETLTQARLPNFQLPTAVEVLTSGTYTRLPSCIRDRIVPPDPIKPEEKAATLIRLNQIIQHRLVITNLPPQMRNLKIEHGRVVFHIPFEFELTLTLMGDKPQIPWRVLNVAILVEDKETGEGKDLVHSLQTAFLQHLVQEKLAESVRPLYDAFDILHSFCLSLQLEVLHAQTVRLSRERLGDFLKVDEYQLGSRLVIAYWKDQIVENQKGCKLVIEIKKDSEQNDALIVSHLPELGDKAELAKQAIKSDVLSIEKLLICTTHERARKILLQFVEKFEATKYGKSFNYEICGLPPVLQISYLKPCMDSEKLTLSVDVLTGLIMVHIAQFDNCPYVDEIQQSIKKDLVNFERLISDLRIWVTKERFKKTAEYFFSTVREQLPFSSKEQNSVVRDRHQKLYFQFLKSVDHYFVVVFTDQTDGNNNVLPDYYLMNVEPAPIEYENRLKTDLDEIQKSFLTVKSLIKLNKACILKPDAKQLDEARKQFGIKRKFDEIDEADGEAAHEDSFFIAELVYLYSFCEERMAYSLLSTALQRHNVCHHIRFNSSPDHAQYIDVIQLPTADGDSKLNRLHRNLLSCSISLQGKFNKAWVITYKFANKELPENLAKNASAIKSTISLSSDFQNSSTQAISRLIDEMLNDWVQFAKLYDILLEFTKLTNYANYLEVFEFASFNYKRMVLNYGPNFRYMVAITWRNHENRYALSFGVVDSTLASNNPHVIVSVQLQDEFNQHRSINILIKALNATVNALSTIHQITCIPMLGLIHSVRMRYSKVFSNKFRIFANLL